MTETESQRNEARTFLSVLYSTVTPDTVVELRLINTPDNAPGRPERKEKIRVTDWSGIEAAWDAGTFEGVNVYIGCGLRGSANPDGGLSNTQRWGFVWADLDGTETWETRLGDVPAPSLVVHSGHGTHLYWLLAEPVGPKAESFVHRVVRGIQQRLEADRKAAEPARVLRLPGTTNQKDGSPVRLLGSWPERRYILAELDARFGADPPGWTAQPGKCGWCETKGQEEGALPTAVPPIKVGERLRNLIINGWTEGCGFPSASELDFAVATEMLRGGHTEGEVVWVFTSPLFGFSRAKHRRPDYIKRTIAAARQAIQQEEPTKKRLKVYQLDDLLTMPLERPAPVVDRMVYDRAITLVAGRPKLGKTFWVMQLIASVATGRPFLDEYPTSGPLPVLYFSAELPDYLYKDRWMQSFHALYASATPNVAVCFDKTLSVQADFDTILAEIQRMQPKLVVFDPWIRYHDSDEQDNTEMARALKQLDRLIQQSETAIVIVHHVRKSSFEGFSDEMDAIRGASVLRSHPNVNIVLAPDRQEMEDDGDVVKRVKMSIESNFSEPERPSMLRRTGALFEKDGVFRKHPPNVVMDILRAVEGQALRKDDLAKVLQHDYGLARSVAYKRLEGILPSGVFVERRGDGHEWYILKEVATNGEAETSVA